MISIKPETALQWRQKALASFNAKGPNPDERLFFDEIDKFCRKYYATSASNSERRDAKNFYKYMAEPKGIMKKIRKEIRKIGASSVIADYYMCGFQHCDKKEEILELREQILRLPLGRGKRGEIYERIEVMDKGLEAL